MSKSLQSEEWPDFLAMLIELRLDANLTQTELGTRMGRTQSFVSKIERGERRLDVIEFCEWVELLGQDPAQMIGRFRNRH